MRELRHVSGEQEIDGRIYQQLPQDARLDCLHVSQLRRGLAALGGALSSLQSPGQVGSFQRRRGEVNDEDCAWMPPPLISAQLVPWDLVCAD